MTSRRVALLSTGSSRVGKRGTIMRSASAFNHHHHHQQQQQQQQFTMRGPSQRLFLSSWTGKGQDLLVDAFGSGRPKVLLEAMGPSGFDVSNLIKKIDPNEVAPHGALHMTGSILAFPNACFLWRIENPSEITVESLAPVLLHRPKIEYIFFGTAKPMDRNQLEHLQKEMKEKGNIVVEWLPLAEAISTFNILNGEDRMVATALVLDKDETHYVKEEDD